MSNIKEKLLYKQFSSSTYYVILIHLYHFKTSENFRITSE